MKINEIASFNTDNPGGTWLKSKIEYCKERGTTEYGAPNVLRGRWYFASK